MRINILLIILTGILFSACSMSEPKLDTKIDTDENYSVDTDLNVNVNAKWWEEYNSVVLNKLIEKALSKNPSLLASYEKIIQAQITLNNAGESYKPSLKADAQSSINKSYPNGADHTTAKRTNAQVSMSYELDIWGKVAAQIEAANSNISVSIYDQEAAKLSLVSNIIQNYFEYISTKEKLSLSKKNLTLAKKTLDIMNHKFDFGEINYIDLSRQKQVYLQESSSLVSLQNELNSYKNALAILVGDNPSSFEIDDHNLTDISIPKINAGLPSDLLYKRPDIASQKAAIESSKALIQVADATRFPSFSLSAAMGSASEKLISLNNPTNSISAGLGISYNILDYTRLNNLKLIEESKARALVQNYKDTVLNAFREVEDSLNSINYTTKELILEYEVLDESKKAFEIAKIQYKLGAIDFNTFLDIQKSFFNAQQQYINVQKKKLIATLNLNKALGGGFKY